MDLIVRHGVWVCFAGGMDVVGAMEGCGGLSGSVGSGWAAFDGVDMAIDARLSSSWFCV